MTTITDVYRLLFGRSGTNKASDVDIAEHGRVGGVSTGQPFKFTSDVDPDTGVSTSQSILLLRRIVKLLESNAVVDINNRQKILIDAVTIGSGPVGLSVTGADSLLATTNWPTRLAPIQQPSTANWQPCWIGPVDQRFQIIDAARLTYDNGIRSHLSFT